MYYAPFVASQLNKNMFKHNGSQTHKFICAIKLKPETNDVQSTTTESCNNKSTKYHK